MRCSLSTPPSRSCRRLPPLLYQRVALAWCKRVVLGGARLLPGGLRTHLVYQSLLLSDRFPNLVDVAPVDGPTLPQRAQRTQRLSQCPLWWIFPPFPLRGAGFPRLAQGKMVKEHS